MRVNGITLFSNPMVKNAAHTPMVMGALSPLTIAKSQSAIAANATRRNTTVRGGSSEITTSTKKNAPPQRKDNVNNITHSLMPIRLLIEESMILNVAVTICCVIS